MEKLLASNEGLQKANNELEADVEEWKRKCLTLQSEIDDLQAKIGVTQDQVKV